MSLEYFEGMVAMSPGPIDIHGHPRILSPLPEGKAGLPAYTATMLASGFVQVSAMPNEARLVWDELTETYVHVQEPIANVPVAREIEAAVAGQAVLKTAINWGINKHELITEGGQLDEALARQRIGESGGNAPTLKLWVDESTGGMNIPIPHAVRLTGLWHEAYPLAPVTIHAENGNVRNFLDMLAEEQNGQTTPIHVAHVSSQEELEPIIEAKLDDRPVTCEATPHHLFTIASRGSLIGGMGCMKPGLKLPSDVKFLWDNIGYIDAFASDCAPHRYEEKTAEPPQWGVTNHTVMMPLLLGAVEEGRISLEDLYQKVVVRPREIFHFAPEDDTYVAFDTRTSYASAIEAERMIVPGYGENIFVHLEEIGAQFTLAGILRFARSGLSSVHQAVPGEWLREYHNGNQFLVRPDATKY